MRSTNNKTWAKKILWKKIFLSSPTHNFYIRIAMSYLEAIPNDGKTDQQRYDEFMSYLLSKGVLSKVLDSGSENYDGQYPGVIQEKVSADLSLMGSIFDKGGDNKDLVVARHRSMLIRAFLDKEIRKLCKGLDSKIKYDLPEEDLCAIKELNLTNNEIEDDIYVRPFALYEVDIKHLYELDLKDLPESPVQFAKLALEHEMDCVYVDSDDDEDWMEDEDGEESEGESESEDNDNVDEEDEEIEMKDVKGKGKAVAAVEDVESEDDEEHVHGEHCNHGHGDGFGLTNDLPFDEDKVSVHNSATGLALLKDHQEEVVALLEKLSGAKVGETFKSYHFPGRYYVVAWLEGFGMFGIRIAYPMLVDDSDDEDEE